MTTFLDSTFLDNRFAYNRPIFGCEVSVDPGNSNQFIISDSILEFYDQDLSTENPPFVPVAFSQVTLPRPPELTAAMPVVYILIGKDGSINYQNNDITIAQFPDFVRIGAIYTFDGGATITGAVSFTHDCSDASKILHVTGPVNVGLNIRVVPISGTLSFAIVGGDLMGLYESWYTSKKNRSVFAFPSSFSPATFVHSDRDGNFSAPRTTIDPTVYDNGSGVVTVPGNNDVTIQYVYGSRDGAIVVLYGQEVFANFNVGERAERNAIVRPGNLEGLPLIGRIIVRKDASNLENINQAIINPVNVLSYSP